MSDDFGEKLKEAYPQKPLSELAMAQERAATKDPSLIFQPERLGQITPNQSQPLWQIRPIAEDEIPLIYSSWLNSLRASGCDAMPKRIYYRHYRAIIDRLLARDDTHVLAAVSPRPAQWDGAVRSRIYGWLCVSQVTANAPIVVHWAYTKKHYRRKGVLRSLFTAARIGAWSDVVYTLSTKRSRKIAEKARSAEYLAVEEFVYG